MNFLLGQVMRLTQGKANPQLARQLILDKVFQDMVEST